MKLGQNFVKYFVHFLGNGVSRKNAFEIYWPLKCNFEVGVNTFWHKYLPLQTEQVHPITETSKNKSWVAHARSPCHCKCSLEMLTVRGTVWSWREVEAEARGCRGWGLETLRTPRRLAQTSVMESFQDWSFKNMTQFLKKKSKSNIMLQWYFVSKIVLTCCEKKLF